MCALVGGMHRAYVTLAFVEPPSGRQLEVEAWKRLGSGDSAECECSRHDLTTAFALRCVGFQWCTFP